MPDPATSIASSSASAAAQSAAAANAASSGNRVISSDFQTFLEMLTVQMTNQDPLNPIDSSDYAVQLATFSSVEQQVLSNDLLTTLIGQMSDTGITQLAGWVGMDARTAAPVHFDGSPITLSPLPAVLADEAWLVVRDEDGTEITREQIDLSGDEITWAGVDDNGAPFAAGTYSFEVENHSDGSLLGTTPVESYSNVVEAQNYNGTMVLVLEGGVQVLTSDVVALRNPL
jgi:flagellar basal-body rod modification protein FlgD